LHLGKYNHVFGLRWFQDLEKILCPSRNNTSELAILDLCGDFQIYVHIRFDAELIRRYSKVNIYEIACVSKDFKSWSLANKQPVNDDDKPPAGATPIALAVPDAPLRTRARS
jgi:hypothetical protein